MVRNACPLLPEFPAVPVTTVICFFVLVIILGITEFFIHLCLKHSLKCIPKQIFQHLLDIMRIRWLVVFEKTIDEFFSFRTKFSS